MLVTAMIRKDVFGKAIVDASGVKKVVITLRRDDGYLDQEDASHYFTTFQEFSQAEKDAIQLAHSKVLDVGCGAGRHSLYLQSKGLCVVSLDISALTIRVAKKNGSQRPHSCVSAMASL
jgi:2-polyprenyl-3-methyl-5-hydroxy-6-metoxy-1,4-benzoquinol methylase